MEGAKLNIDTHLIELRLDDKVRVVDVLWESVPLNKVDWEQVPRLGDEAQARLKEQTGVGGGLMMEMKQWSKNPEEWQHGFQTAARAYRQLAIALRGQGFSEAADRFTYRAFVMQRKGL